MKKNELVSIILPCYNAENYIGQTLESIKNQTYKCFEVIIIDDGSKDNSLKIIQNFFKINNNIKNEIISRENKGFIDTLIEGISISNGSLIARIDSDDCWENNHLEISLNEFFLNDKLVLTGALAYFIDSNNLIIGESKKYSCKNNIIKGMMRDSVFIHSSVIFRRSAYFKTCGYDNDFLYGKDHIADYNLWSELMLIGDFKILNNKTVRYRVLNNSMSRKINKIINYKSRLQVMRKVYSNYKKHLLYSLFFRFLVRLKILKLKIGL